MVGKNSLILFILLCLCTSIYSQDEDSTLLKLMNMPLKELGDVKIITSGKHYQVKNESPSTITVITGEELELFGINSLWEALQTVIGTIPGDNGTTKIIGFRGQLNPGVEISSILWLIDGHTLNTSYFQTRDIDQGMGVTIDNIERIEIVRGPGSVLYGSNAFSGLVNIITKSGEKHDGVSVFLETGGYSNTAGGYKIDEKQDVLSLLGSNISFGKKYSNLGDIYVSTAYHKNYGQLMYIPYFTGTERDSVVDQADYMETYNILANYKYQSFKVFGQFVNTTEGNPMADYWATPNSKKNKYHNISYFIESQYKHEWNKEVSTMARIFFDSHEFTGTWYYEGFSPLDKQHVPSQWYGGELQLSWKKNKSFLLTGIEYQKHYTQQIEDYPSENNYYAKNDYNYFNYAVYIQEDLNIFKKININAGGRYDVNENYGGVFITKGSVFYKPNNKSIIKLLYGNAFKNPLLHDYFYRSSVLQERQDNIVKLKRERITTYEIGWVQFFKEFKTDLVLFYSQQDNSVKVNTEFDHYYNGKGDESLGVELEFSYKFGTKMYGYINGSYFSIKDSETNDMPLNSPDFIFKFGMIYRILPENKLNFALNGQYYSEADYEDSSERPGIDFKQDAYTVVNININSQKVIFGSDISFGIYNLFNASYEYAIFKGTRQSFPANGQNFRIKVSRNF